MAGIRNPRSWLFMHVQIWAYFVWFSQTFTVNSCEEIQGWAVAVWLMRLDSTSEDQLLLQDSGGWTWCRMDWHGGGTQKWRPGLKIRWRKKSRAHWAPYPNRMHSKVGGKAPLSATIAGSAPITVPQQVDTHPSFLAFFVKTPNLPRGPDFCILEGPQRGLSIYLLF